MRHLQEKDCIAARLQRLCCGAEVAPGIPFCGVSALQILWQHCLNSGRICQATLIY